jgi:hypothetical protein
MINKLSVTRCIPPSDRSADGELKLTSFYSSWLPCPALGHDKFTHSHGYAVLYVPPFFFFVFLITFVIFV